MTGWFGMNHHFYLIRPKSTNNDLLITYLKFLTKNKYLAYPFYLEEFKKSYHMLTHYTIS